MTAVTEDENIKDNLGENRFAYVAGESGKWSIAWDVADIFQVPDCGIFKPNVTTSSLYYMNNGVKQSTLPPIFKSIIDPKNKTLELTSSNITDKGTY